MITKMHIWSTSSPMLLIIYGETENKARFPLINWLSFLFVSGIGFLRIIPFELPALNNSYTFKG